MSAACRTIKQAVAFTNPILNQGLIVPCAPPPEGRQLTASLSGIYYGAEKPHHDIACMAPSELMLTGETGQSLAFCVWLNFAGRPFLSAFAFKLPLPGLYNKNLYLPLFLEFETICLLGMQWQTPAN